MIPWQSCVIWLGYPVQNGVWPDVSNHDNDGVITGAVWGGDSLEFDGIDDIVVCGNHSSLDITAEITIEALIKPYTLGGGLYGRIMNKRDVYMIYMNATQRVRFSLRDSLDVVHNIYANTNSVIMNEWSHIIGTYNGIIQKTYINSALQSETALWSDTIKSMPTKIVYVGNIYTPVRGFDGKIAFVRVYNKAFSAQQVREAYEQAYRLV